jgi:uncharacterized protein YhbP (UPF0306 family)
MAWQTKENAVSTEALEESISAILAAVPLCAVGTVRAGQPWVASMYFATQESGTLYVLTPPTTRHASAWQADPIVAVAIYDSTQPFDGMKRGLQLTAKVEQIAVAQSEPAISSYGERYPMMQAWLSGVEDLERLESRFFELTVVSAKVFDEPRFGAEVWIEATRA